MPVQTLPCNAASQSRAWTQKSCHCAGPPYLHRRMLRCHVDRRPVLLSEPLPTPPLLLHRQWSRRRGKWRMTLWPPPRLSWRSIKLSWMLPGRRTTK